MLPRSIAQGSQAPFGASGAAGWRLSGGAAMRRVRRLRGKFAAREAAGREEAMKKLSYWGENLRLVAILLSVWFAISFGCGVLLVDYLNRFTLGGFKLGFWFAQQGSMYGFLVLIFVYVALMNRIDRKHGVRED